MAHSNNFTKFDIIRELMQNYGKDINPEVIKETAKQNNYDLFKSHQVLLSKVQTMKSSSGLLKPENYATTIAIEAAVSDIKNNFKILILLRGLPGSGKTFLSHSILKASALQTNPSDHIFSADDFFKTRGRYMYDVTKISEAHNWTQRNVFHKMLRGYSPLIVDNTNTELWEMLPYARMAAQCGYKIHILEANTKWCFDCNVLSRKNQHGVPKNKIRSMMERFQSNITTELLLTNYNLTLEYQKNPQERAYPPVNRTQSPLRMYEEAPTSSSVIHNNNSMNKDLKVPESTINFNGNNSPTVENGCKTSKLTELTDDEDEEVNLSESKGVFSPHKIDISSWGIDEKILKSWDIVTLIPSSETQQLSNGFATSSNEKTQLETADQESNTDLLDFYRQINNNDDNCKIIYSTFRDINPKNKLGAKLKPGMLDKSVWTEEDISSDWNEDLNRLYILFPNVPKTYIQEIYEKYKGDLDSTIEIFLEDNKDYSDYETISKQNEASTSTSPSIEPLTTFSEVPSQIEQPSTSSFQFEQQQNIETYDSDSDLEFDQFQPNGSEKIDENEFIELNLGHNLIECLEKEFGDEEINHPKGFQPVVQIPRTFGRQLYAFYIESVYQQMETQKILLDNLVKEDEAFAKKLLEEEKRASMASTHQPQVEGLREIMNEQAALSIYQKDVEKWRNVGPDDLATTMTKKKLVQSFPTVDPKVLLEIYNANDNNYEQTVEDLLMQVDSSDVQCVVNVKEPPINQSTVQELKRADEQYGMAKDKNEDNRTSQSFRDEAGEYLKKRDELYQKAQDYYSRGQMEVAQFYSHLAKKQTQFYDMANSRAATVLLEEHSKRLQNFDTLDLHYLFVKEAIPALDVFIDRNINLLRGSMKNSQNLLVITGRGNRSLNGMSRIKPAVISRLRTRKIQFVVLNPGLLKIKVNKNTVTTSDLQNKN